MGMLNDQEKNKSMMRLMSLLSFVASIGFTCLIYIAELDEESAINAFNFVLIYLVAAFMPKLLQQFIETAHSRTNNPDNQKGYFMDEEGNASLIRFMSLMSFMLSVVFSYLAIKSAGSGVIFNIAWLFIIAAFAPKAFQKYIERAIEPNKIFGAKRGNDED